MGDFRRKADGRRIFDVEFKRATAARIAAGEVTLAEVARELDIQPALIRRWMKLAEGGSAAAVEAGEEAVTDAEFGGRDVSACEGVHNCKSIRGEG